MSILKSKAIYFLSKREYAYLELFNKLKKYSDNFTEIKTLLDELKKDGYLSEDRYIKSYINSKKNKSGIAKIKYNLKLKTGNAQLVDKILAESSIDEYESALLVWQKKFKGAVTTDKTEIARQARFLQSRGFSFTTINKILKKCF
jgi:regulatory protein